MRRESALIKNNFGNNNLVLLTLLYCFCRGVIKDGWRIVGRCLLEQNILDYIWIRNVCLYYTKKGEDLQEKVKPLQMGVIWSPSVWAVTSRLISVALLWVLSSFSIRKYQTEASVQDLKTFDQNVFVAWRIKTHQAKVTGVNELSKQVKVLHWPKKYYFKSFTLLKNWYRL